MGNMGLNYSPEMPSSTNLYPLFLSVCASLISLPLVANADLISGPMLGPVSMREALVWIQTDSASSVRINYANQSAPNITYQTDPVQTSAENLYSATLRLSAVEPGNTYTYQVEVDGQLSGEVATIKTPQYYHGKTPPPDFRIAVVGAHYREQAGYEPPYLTLGGGYDIFSTLLSKQPALTIWAGNTAHLRTSDYDSLSGYLKRYAYARSLPEARKLLANVPNYATWGSADYGPKGTGADYSNKAYAQKAFTTFWPQSSPIAKFGLVSRFQYADADFFILDVQSSREDNPTAKDLPIILGKEQLRWLRNEVTSSQATFKFIIAGAPILNPANNERNLSFADREQKEMLQLLRDERTSGLFFISGGKPYGELTKLVHVNSYNLFDLTVGPITAAPTDNADELNYFRVPGTSLFERHFALIDISGEEDSRVITLSAVNMEGTVLWQQKILESELQAGN